MTVKPLFVWPCNNYFPASIQYTHLFLKIIFIAQRIITIAMGVCGRDSVLTLSGFHGVGLFATHNATSFKLLKLWQAQIA